MKYESCFKSYIDLIEKQLAEVLPPPEQYPSVIHEAMRYAVLNGGKRFRPILTLAACQASGGRTEDAIFPAVSIELIHAYSLVHDDLPALDNDGMRRGKPSCHKQFGEAIAILAGDGLLTLGFHVLHRVKPAPKAVRLLEEISTACGTYGMIGGQVADLTVPQKEFDLPVVDYINIHKTGKLIKACAVNGAIAAGASREVQLRMHRFGEFLGLAFQSVDDLLDGDGYMRIVNSRDLRQKVRDLIAQAKREIRPLGAKAQKLQLLADFLLRRMPRKSHEAVSR